MWWEVPGVIDLPEMVLIPAGSFLMGTAGDDRFASSTERPAHKVLIASPFAVSRFPITEAKWREFICSGPGSLLPAVGVSWRDAMDFTLWLSSRSGRAFRLLTEAEWEYCCRAGSTTIFASGDSLEPAQANYLYDEHGIKTGPGGRTPPGTYPANAFGLEDMHGNVCEWVADAWRPTYGDAPNPGYRTIRGGAWDYMPRLLRSAWRDFAAPDAMRDNLGFRVACHL
jgi:formylglycine-generating enzyme required for sulfatase activity